MRHFFIIIGLLAVSVMAQAGYSKGYYDRLEGKSMETLKNAVKESVSRHTVLTYSQLPGYWQYTDVYPELVDGCKRWWDMYSDELCVIGRNQDAFSSFRSYGMQREHSVPKSWWKLNGDVEYTPAYSDLWNLYPSNGEANQAKLNYPFGECSTTKYNNGVSKVGTPEAGYGGGSAYVFEPGDEYKGDFARSMFYMACVYNDINWVINYMFRKETYPTLVPWAMNMLLQWARTDRVSQKEIDRNNLVEQYQGNRNPFVDFPELAEYIWGSRTTEIFRIEDQDNTDPTPPITGDPTLTSPVNGETLQFDQTAVGNTVTRALQIQGSNFTAPLSVLVSGTDRDYFKAETTEIPAATLNASGYLLEISYKPTVTGKHEAKLVLYDGGLDGSVVVNLSGEALDVPEFTALQALEATNITDSGYRANWLPAQGIADYYVVKRVKYDGDNQEAEIYETAETYLDITDRDPEIAETYTVSYSRLGLMSPESNTIYVAATGVKAVEYEIPYRAIGIEGRIVILTGDGEPVRNLVVADASGRTITSLDATDGMEIELPAGVYILYAPGHKPHIVMVR